MNIFKEIKDWFISFGEPSEPDLSTYDTRVALLKSGKYAVQWTYGSSWNSSLTKYATLERATKEAIDDKKKHIDKDTVKVYKVK